MMSCCWHRPRLACRLRHRRGCVRPGSSRARFSKGLAGTTSFGSSSSTTRNDRTRLLAETVAEGRLRDFLGFNRARHAVVEAAILATRTAFLPRAEILAEFDKLAGIVAKTGGPAEHAAFQLLNQHVLLA